MTRNRWIIFVLICVVTLGALVWTSKKDKVDTTGQDPQTIVASTDTVIGDHVFGKADSPVVLFEYGDFQCPACGQAHAPLKALVEKYKGQIAFVFRNFPLTSIHPNALAASTAAEAASLQGKYWEMHDKLYEQQDAWSNADASDRTDVFAGYARDLGLDADRFKADLSDKRVSEKISVDRSLGSRLNVDSTPTLYLNGTLVDRDTLNDLLQSGGNKLMDQIDAALKSANITPPKR